MTVCLAPFGHVLKTSKDLILQQPVSGLDYRVLRVPAVTSTPGRLRTSSCHHPCGVRFHSRLLASASAWPTDPAETGTAGPVSQQHQATVETEINSSDETATVIAAHLQRQELTDTTVSAADAHRADINAHATVAQRLAGCPECSGSGRVTCKECEGRGFLKRGGYNKKNPLNMSRITGSKWTAMHETLGWRHFRVLQQRKLDKHTVYLLLQASCDSTVQLWVNAQTLRNRASWAAGWLQMSEIQGLGAEVQSAGHKCQSCTGLGYKPCIICDGTGRPSLVVLR